MEFYEYSSFCEGREGVKIDPVDFLTRKSKTGIWLASAELSRYPFAINQGGEVSQQGIPPYRAFTDQRIFYNIDSLVQEVTMTSIQPDFNFSDIDDISHKVVMEGEPRDLLDAFLARKYQFIDAMAALEQLDEELLDYLGR